MKYTLLACALMMMAMIACKKQQPNQHHKPITILLVLLGPKMEVPLSPLIQLTGPQGLGALASGLIKGLGSPIILKSIGPPKTIPLLGQKP
ncbi:MAG: hypothetical protein IPG85_13980 [Bacteroidetes bacterium]|nr:hypothetical protein [Bacteroidota bacterium]